LLLVESAFQCEEFAGFVSPNLKKMSDRAAILTPPPPKTANSLCVGQRPFSPVAAFSRVVVEKRVAADLKAANSGKTAKAAKSLWRS